MIHRNDLFSLAFYKKSPFTGSYQGMRYKISKETITDSENEDQTILRAYVFPGPFNYETTPKENMIIQDFPFSEDGINNICNWLNEIHQSHQDLWKTTLF